MIVTLSTFNYNSNKQKYILHITNKIISNQMLGANELVKFGVVLTVYYNDCSYMTRINCYIQTQLYTLYSKFLTSVVLSRHSYIHNSPEWLYQDQFQ